MADDVDPGPTGRLLALLSLLQARPHWPGPELADRLDVTIRTVRRDVERLRRLGYPVLADIGTTGGYRLGAGGRAMPPLMLDRDEALAVAVCLRSTATESIAGGGEAAIRALAKLEQLLPSTLRRQVGAISTMTARLGGGSTPVDPEVLVTLTRACRDGERLRARYRDQRGRETDRRLDPHRLVTTARRWYLVARDVDRDAWRTLPRGPVAERGSDRPPGHDRRSRRTRWRSCSRRSRRRRTATRPASSWPRRSPTSSRGCRRPRASSRRSTPIGPCSRPAATTST